MEKEPVIKNENDRQIYGALLKSARLLLQQDGLLRVVDSAMTENNSFDLPAMARALTVQLDDISMNRKPARPGSRDMRTDKSNPDPNALRSFSQTNDKAFYKGLTNPTSGYR